MVITNVFCCKGSAFPSASQGENHNPKYGFPYSERGKTFPGQSRNHCFTIHLTAKQQAEKQDNGGMWKAFVWEGRRHHNAKA